MEVIYKTLQNKILNGFSGVGLGNFDGLHIGHMTLIDILIKESKLCGLKSLVYTFTKHPENILRKKLFTSLLTTVDKKIQLLDKTNLDYLYFDEFDEEFSRIEPKIFVENVLVDTLKIKLAVAGSDYKFGYRGHADVEFLKMMGKKFNFKVLIIPPVKIQDKIISSTDIRNKLSKGNVESVFNLLGRHYSIEGKVLQGKSIGRLLGFPTANIRPEGYITVPKNGVYATKVLFGGEYFSGITNIGNNPTFGELQHISIETHILNFDKNIYDENIEVFFISRIRDEKKFDSKDELIRQIHKDILTMIL